MAKKKNYPKKHKFKHVEQGAVDQPQVQAQTPGTQAQSQPMAVDAARPAKPAAATIMTSGRDFSYVKSDLRRIAILAGALVAIEVGMYYVFAHTPVGDTIYALVKV